MRLPTGPYKPNATSRRISREGSSELSVLESMSTGPSEQMRSTQRENASPASELDCMKTLEKCRATVQSNWEAWFVFPFIEILCPCVHIFCPKSQYARLR